MNLNESKESLKKEASQTIADRLCWVTAAKDQAGITQDLADGKDISEVYGLGEAGLFDEFFCFLDQFGIMEPLKKIAPNLFKRVSNINFSVVILIYVMRIVAGLKFFWHSYPVLLRSQPLMRLVGFNGREIREGTCKRGLHRTTVATEESDETQSAIPIAIRGPVCLESITSYIAAISAHKLEWLFNTVVKILAKNSFFPKKINAILDATDIESTEQCEGCGMVMKEKAPALRLRKKRLRKVMEKVFGFKTWVVWDSASRLPLAIRFALIEVGDINYAQEVLQQAIENLGEYAVIKSLAFDKGFLDGKFMWWLNQRGINFYVPAKTNMDVYSDALSLVQEGIREHRESARTVGAGKNKQTIIDRWEVVGIEGLTSASFYGDEGSGSHTNRKSFQSNPINAVVVVHDPYLENNPNIDTMVILTNAPVTKPLKVYDGYDARSEIENGLFREAKQAWFIQRPATNTCDGFRCHVYLTLMIMALTTAFRDWMEKQDKLHNQGQETGIRKFRERVKQENGNKLIIFDENRYAIFDSYEVLILCGTTVLQPHGVPERITKEDILRKYGAVRE